MPARSKERASSFNHFVVGWLVFLFFFFLLDRVSCNPGWLQTSDPPASGALVLGLEMHNTTPSSPVLSEVMLCTLVHLTLFLIIHLGGHQPGNVLPAGKTAGRTESWIPRLSSEKE